MGAAPENPGGIAGMGRATRFVLIALAVIVTVAAAYFAGSKAGGFWTERQRMEHLQEYRSQALSSTRAVLDKMGTVEVGDTLSDFSFEDIDGQFHRLSDILIDNTLLVYMEPGCGACLDEIETLSKTVKTPDEYRHFVLISTANPLHMHKMRDEFGLKCLMMYDEQRVFGNNLNIVSFPFGLLVSRERVIQNAYAFVLEKEELNDIASGRVPAEAQL